MKVKITYNDNQSLTVDEIIKNNKNVFGENAEVSVHPNNDAAEAQIYHGIQRLITEEQITLFFDKGKHLYQEEIPKLRQKILKELEEVLNQVIIDNEERVS